MEYAMATHANVILDIHLTKKQRFVWRYVIRRVDAVIVQHQINVHAMLAMKWVRTGYASRNVRMAVHMGNVLHPKNAIVDKDSRSWIMHVCPFVQSKWEFGLFSLIFSCFWRCWVCACVSMVVIDSSFLFSWLNNDGIIEWEYFCRGCANGICTAPDHCSCHVGYRINKSGTCDPKCDKACLNGI